MRRGLADGCDVALASFTQSKRRSDQVHWLITNDSGVEFPQLRFRQFADVENHPVIIDEG